MDVGGGWLKEKRSRKCGELDARISEAHTLDFIGFLSEVSHQLGKGHSRPQSSPWPGIWSVSKNERGLVSLISSSVTNLQNGQHYLFINSVPK